MSYVRFPRSRLNDPLKTASSPISASLSIPITFLAAVLLLTLTNPALSQTATAANSPKTSNLIGCIAKIMELPRPPTDPVIRTVSQIDMEKIAGGFASIRARGGAPVGLYLPPGLIFISTAAQPDDLAHEIAHHYQFHNKISTQGKAAEDQAEAVRREAVSSCM
jgi:hypothetical protein